MKILQYWDREGTLKANRTPTDRRYLNSYRTWYLFSTFSLVDCTDFVSIKKQIERDEKIAKELQDGDRPNTGAEGQN